MLFYRRLWCNYTQTWNNDAENRQNVSQKTQLARIPCKILHFVTILSVVSLTWMCRFGLPVTSTCFSDHCNLIPIPEHVNHVRFPLRTIFDAKYASLVPNTANGEKMERKFVNEMKYRKEILNGWEKKNAISGFWCKKYAPFLWLQTLLSHFDRIIVEWMQTVDSYQPICITESEEERKKLAAIHLNQFTLFS